MALSIVVILVINTNKVNVNTPVTTTSTPTATLTTTPAPTPTQSPNLQGAYVTISPPILYSDNGGPYTFAVSINNPAYWSLMNKLATENMTTVLLAGDGGIFVNYGIQPNNYTVTNISNGGFYITLYAEGSPHMYQGREFLPRDLAECFNKWLSVGGS